MLMTVFLAHSDAPHVYEQSNRNFGRIEPPQHRKPLLYILLESRTWLRGCLHFSIFYTKFEDRNLPFPIAQF